MHSNFSFDEKTKKGLFVLNTKKSTDVSIYILLVHSRHKRSPFVVSEKEKRTSRNSSENVGNTRPTSVVAPSPALAT